MPDPRPLKERFIQNAVAERLNRKYYRRDGAYVSTEEYRKLKRADVFLAFMRAPGRPYVVVVEAKSRTTIHQLKLKDNETRVRWTGRVVALLLIVVLSAVLGYQWYFNALNTLLLLSLFLVGAVAISALITRLNLSFLKSVAAIEQLGRYPANESWIAVGEDTFAKPEEYRSLWRQCAKNGVGLIVVDRKERLDLVEIPRPRHAFNNYLKGYGKEETILKRIDKSADYGPTPPERAKQRRQLGRAALLLAGVAILGLMGYEQRFGPVVPDPFAASLPGSSEGVTIEADDPFGEDNAGPAVLREGARPTTTLDCKSLTEIAGGYVVVDIIGNKSQVQRRANQLSVAGLRGHEVVRMACLGGQFTRRTEKYLLHTGVTYSDRRAAARAAESFRQLMDELRRPTSIGEAYQIKRD